MEHKQKEAMDNLLQQAMENMLKEAGNNSAENVDKKSSTEERPSTKPTIAAEHTDNKLNQSVEKKATERLDKKTAGNTKTKSEEKSENVEKKPAENRTKKAPMTHEERMALCAKLDAELEEFMVKLPKRTDKQPENVLGEWEEDLTSHPFFMKDAPDGGVSPEMHPLYEGLMNLKYDPNENEPEELAASYKDDGNHCFKYKKYRMAVISYTEGLLAKCMNDDLNATLYNNRAAAQFHLENYRSALRDCEAALKLKPDYVKAAIRAADCCFKTEKFDRAIEFCDAVLDIDKSNVDMLALRKKAAHSVKIKEKNKRKMEMQTRKKETEEERLVEEITKRGFRIRGIKGKLNLNLLEPQLPELCSNRVSLSDEGTLVWPVVLFYPEYKIFDYIQAFDENVTFLEQFSYIFEHPPGWDREGKYTVDKVNVYFESCDRKIVKVDINSTLHDAMKLKGYVIEQGTPRFIVLVAGSKAEERFLEVSS